MYFFLTQKLSQNCNRCIGIYFHFCTRWTDLGLLKINSHVPHYSQRSLHSTDVTCTHSTFFSFIFIMPSNKILKRIQDVELHVHVWNHKKILTFVTSTLLPLPLPCVKKKKSISKKCTSKCVLACGEAEYRASAARRRALGSCVHQKHAFRDNRICSVWMPLKNRILNVTGWKFTVL